MSTSNRTHVVAQNFTHAMWNALGGNVDFINEIEFLGDAELPAVFSVSDFAAATFAVVGAAISELVQLQFNRKPSITVDKRLASLWYGWSIKPIGWNMPSAWDAIAGDYLTKDGWIRLHTNAPHHRMAALSTLRLLDQPSKEKVVHAVAQWNADELEAAVISAGGCAATMRSMQDWRLHPQGRSVSTEPLLAIQATSLGATLNGSSHRSRPLQGLRVLDLTRVLAGPVATRVLAGYGAEVLRIDPLDWDEPGVIPEVTVGKRCARLDLRETAAREQLQQLLRQAHILIHGYRPGALDRLGLDAKTRQQFCPGLIDISLDAYGWTGPWRDRRGFDSLVQMSSGIAHAGMIQLNKDRPTPLPVQALDHATGYLMAAAAIRGITQRLSNGRGSEVHASLARTAQLLVEGASGNPASNFQKADEVDYADDIENTEFGPAHRLRSALSISGTPMYWDRPATQLGSANPQWL